MAGLWSWPVVAQQGQGTEPPPAAAAAAAAERITPERVTPERADTDAAAQPPHQAQQSPQASQMPPSSPAQLDRLPTITAPAAALIAAPALVPEPGNSLPEWALSLLILFGAFLAGLFGLLTMMLMRRSERAARRRSLAFALATELETRRMAFDTVPLPPNAEAGVSFVSSVTSLSGIDAAFQMAQGDLFLLTPKLASSLSVHYAAVRRVSDFVKGQSLAAAARMMQANRLGGYPCPDAGTMREAYEELNAAFRGTDKVVHTLRGLAD